MDPLIVISKDNIAYRLEPYAIYDMNDVIARAANQSFTNIKKHTMFDVATAVGPNGVTYKPTPFHLATTKKNEAVYWGYITGMVFDTSFTLVEHNGTSRLIPDFSGRSSDGFKDKIFCSADKMSTSDCTVRFLMAVVINRDQSGFNGKMTPYFCFQLCDGSKNTLIGNYLPCIPNVFVDARVCMGGAFSNTIDPNKSTEAEVARAIKWFFETRMNSDLIDQGADRMALSERLIGWNKDRIQVAPLESAKRLLSQKVGNFYLDGLPYAATGWN